VKRASYVRGVHLTTKWWRSCEHQNRIIAKGGPIRYFWRDCPAKNKSVWRYGLKDATGTIILALLRHQCSSAILSSLSLFSLSLFALFPLSLLASRFLRLFYSAISAISTLSIVVMKVRNRRITSSQVKKISMSADTCLRIEQ
jgi:hypothetical protein